MADENKRKPPESRTPLPGWINRLPEGASVTTSNPGGRSKVIMYGKGVGPEEFFRGPNQWEYLNNREEDPAGVDTYARGGRVKHGSSTVVSCRSK